ncbi:MAG: permease [Planctomycetota bacterium]
MTYAWNLLLGSLRESGILFTQMAPFLLLGFLANGLVAMLVPERWIAGHLGRPGFKGVLWATLLGIPLPLCSCSVLPMAMGLRARGASIGATIAFLIATPQTGVDSILVTGQMIGWPFALFKVVEALATGLVAGGLAEWWLGGRAGGGVESLEPSPVGGAPEPSSPLTALPWSERVRRAFLTGFWDFPSSLGGVLIVGILIGGALSALIPPGELALHSQGGRLLSMLVMLALAVPMYVCSTGSVPIAAGFQHAGVPQGALLVFLMAGPATNIAAISVIRRRLGWASLGIFLGVIVVASVGLGVGFEDMAGLMQFQDAGATMAAHAGHMHGMATPSAAAPALAVLSGWDWAAVGSLALLLLLPPFWKMEQALMVALKKAPNPGAKKEDPTMAKQAEPAPSQVKTYEFDLEGLNCDHCIRSTKDSLQGLPGLESLTVSLHRAVLKGKNLNVAEVEDRVRKQGYEAHLNSPTQG